MSRYRRKKSKKIVGSALTIAKKALKGVKKLNKKVGKAELKYTNSGITTGAITSTGTITQLCLSSEGTSDVQHIGAAATIRKLQMIGAIRIHTSATNTSFRCIVFRDRRQVADTKTSVTDVLTDVNPLSPLESITANRFHIIYDKFIYLDLFG